MKHQVISSDRLVVVKLSGEVTASDWQRCFADVAGYFALGSHEHLLLDGRDLDSFNVTHAECQRLAKGFVEFANKGAFFSEDPLIFGMVRVIHSYSNNQNFGVCKTRKQALEFIGRARAQSLSAEIGRSLPG